MRYNNTNTTNTTQTTSPKQPPPSGPSSGSITRTTARCVLSSSFLRALPAAGANTRPTQPALYALYRSFTRCVYVEPVDAPLTHEGADRPAGDVLFFRDRRGAPAVGSVGAAAG